MLKIEYKKSLVELGLTELSILKSRYYYFLKIGEKEKALKELAKFNEISKNLDYTTEQMRDAEKLLNAWHQKNKRLRKRIDDMLYCSSDVYFATFTLNNEFINYNVETLKIYLKRVLKANCGVYVANQDYGSENERLHFHAVITCDNIQQLKKSWCYGFTKFEKVNIRSSSSISIAKYITKLTNHALKGSTKPLENKLIYSRDVKSNLLNELVH